MKSKLKSSDYAVIAVLVTVFVFLAIFTCIRIVASKINQIDEVSSIRLERVKMEFQDTLDEAENSLTRYALGADSLISKGASRNQIEDYVVSVKSEQILRSDGINFNAYIAGPGWEIIPDFDMPADYHATERVWYVGAMDLAGDIYVSEPYIDRMTGDLCYTMSRMLSDERTVVAMDFTLSEVQNSISKMSVDNDYVAIIVSKDLTLVGYSDTSLVGQKVRTALPQYYFVLNQVTSSSIHESFSDTVNNKAVTVYSSETDNGWSMVIIADKSSLYGDTYQYIFLIAVVFTVLLAMILIIYIYSAKKRVKAEDTLEARDKFITDISEDLRDPLNSIIKLSDSDRLGHSVNIKEDIESIRESGLVLSQKLDNFFSYSYMVSEGDHPETRIKDRHRNLAKTIRRSRTVIVWLFIVTMVFNIVIGTISGYVSGTMAINLDLDVYYVQLSTWVNQQRSIVDMFSNVIEADPDILDDYEGCVEWLDEIASNYPNISACYMANPYRKHTVIMNTGWTPDYGWRVEDRQWYKDTIASPTGANISSPYYDEQTGNYCITFSRVVYGKNGEFLGVFGIDFFADKLIQIFGDGYIPGNYAFLVDPQGNIINHPNEAYQMTSDSVTNIVYTKYHDLENTVPSLGFRDYNGRFSTGAWMLHDSSGFSIYIIRDWYDIFGAYLMLMALSILMILLCTIIVVLMINRIIRWQHDINDELAQSAKHAADADKAKSRFLAQMSHEIRTPINAVIGMDEMILRETDDRNIREYAENINVAGKTLLELVNGILDFSKIEEGKMEIVPVRYEVTALVSEFYNMIADKAKKKGLDLVFDISPDIPSSLFGDDVRIKQVVVNILTNAVKYTETGSVKLSMRGHYGEDSYLLHIAVKDTGIGIREEDMDKLFKSFQRLDAERNRNIEGTGLGISIVQGLLTRMNSELKVHSVYGEGSEFYFDIEQKVIDRTPVGEFDYANIGQVKIDTEMLMAEGVDVLVVDDNDMNLKVARGLLKFYGIVPDTADNGADCIRMAQVKRYDLIFLDHMMPGKDGIETLKELVAEELVFDTPVICLTANAVSGMKETYLAAGFDDYLAKPIDTGELEKILEKYLPQDKIRKVVRGEFIKEQSVPGEDMSPIEYLNSAGFDTEAGISYSAGSEEFYIEMLQTFAEGYDKKSAEIRSDFDDSNWKDYQTRVHALKSTARMIGIGDLADLALSHEMAAKEGRTEYIKLGLEELMELYAGRVGDIRKAFERGAS